MHIYSIKMAKNRTALRERERERERERSLSIR